MPVPAEPWKRPDGFRYNPESFAPNGQQIKRPAVWYGHGNTQAYPPGYVYDDKGRQVCGYWNRRKNRLCRQTELAANGRCNWHGGDHPSGEDSSNWKGGVAHESNPHKYRYDPYLPEKLVRRYETAMEDVELISMRDELALMTVRIQNIIEQLDQGEAGKLWMQLKGSVQEYHDAEDDAMRALVLADIFAAIRRGAQEYLNWQEIQQLAETRRKLSESEQKRMIALRQYITAEQATHLVATVTDVVLRNVHDSATIARIRDELARVLTSGDSLTVRPVIDATATAQ